MCDARLSALQSMWEIYHTYLYAKNTNEFFSDLLYDWGIDSKTGLSHLGVKSQPIFKGKSNPEHERVFDEGQTSIADEFISFLKYQNGILYNFLIDHWVKGRSVALIASQNQLNRNHVRQNRLGILNQIHGFLYPMMHQAVQKLENT